MRMRVGLTLSGRLLSEDGGLTAGATKG